jgi:DnaJ-class molecular chaperone
MGTLQKPFDKRASYEFVDRKRPLTSQAFIMSRENPKYVCERCEGRGIVIAKRGLFKARMTCNRCNGSGVTASR